MPKRYIYATNSQLTKYQFLIESETDTEYNVVDVDMRSYDATYKVDKKTLKFTAINKQFQFVVDDPSFFASFDQNEIIQKAKYYAIENIEYSIKKQKSPFIRLFDHEILPYCWRSIRRPTRIQPDGCHTGGRP